MKNQKKVELNVSKLYGFKILDGGARSALKSKVGGKIGDVKKPVHQTLGSKIGLSK